MRMNARPALLFLALALPPVVAPAAGAAKPKPPVKRATMVYYAVGGATPEQLRERLDARAPKSPDGYRGDAYTRWEYRWNWPGYGSASCSLTRAVVTVRVVVSFPRWTHPKAAPASLAAAWKRYTRALARHEQGHVDYAVGHRLAVVRAIKGASCSSANAAALEQLDVIRKHDVAYDRSTQHGATQGARFP
jgi:predicted secreted Zn-dependent protease